MRIPRWLPGLLIAATPWCCVAPDTDPPRGPQPEAGGGVREITPRFPQTATTRPAGEAASVEPFEKALARYESALAAQDPASLADCYAPDYRSEVYGVTRSQLPRVFQSLFEMASHSFRVDRGTLRRGATECDALVEITSRGKQAIPGDREGEVRSHARSRLYWAPREGRWMVVRGNLRAESVEIVGGEKGPRLTLEIPAEVPPATLIPVRGTLEAPPQGPCVLTVLCTDGPVDLERPGSKVEVGADGRFETVCRSSSGDLPDRIRAAATCYDPATGVAVDSRILVRAVVRPEAGRAEGR